MFVRSLNREKSGLLIDILNVYVPLLDSEYPHFSKQAAHHSCLSITLRLYSVL